MGKLHIVNFVLQLVKWILVVLPVPGYIHPDEYFQCTEIMASDILNLTAIKTWEWNEKQPARNILFPAIVAGFPFWLLRKFSIFQLSPKILVILPRLSMALLTFATENVFKKINIKYFGMNKQFRLFLFRSSHVTLIFLTPTFSNTLETFLYVVILYYILQKHKMTSNFPKINHSTDFVIGAIFGVGFFVRQTIIAFVFYPLLHFGISLMLKLSFKQFFKLLKFAFCFLCGFVAGAILCIIADHFYFSPNGEWPLTPVNLIKYNHNIENLKLHGVHPWYLHFTVNMVILYGPLYILFLVQSYNQFCTVKKWKNIVQFLAEERMMMTITVFTSIGIISLVPHQEPRYIIPSIIPLIYSVKLPKIRTRSFICSWILFNIVGVVFYGFLHQAGLFPSFVYINKHLKGKSNDRKELDLIFWKTYKVPVQLLMLNKEQTNTRVHDLAGLDLLSMEKSVQLMNYSDKNEVYMFCPSSLHDDLVKNQQVRFILKKQIFPHVTMEDFPNLSIHEMYTKSIDDVYVYLKEAFSLNIYLVKKGQS